MYNQPNRNYTKNTATDNYARCKEAFLHPKIHMYMSYDIPFPIEHITTFISMYLTRQVRYLPFKIRIGNENSLGRK